MTFAASLELQRQRERLWMVSISCIAVTLFAALTTAACGGFWWLGERTQLASSSGKLRSWFLPDASAGSRMFLLARETQLSDHTGGYSGDLAD